MIAPGLGNSAFSPSVTFSLSSAWSRLPVSASQGSLPLSHSPSSATDVSAQFLNGRPRLIPSRPRAPARPRVPRPGLQLIPSRPRAPDRPQVPRLVPMASSRLGPSAPSRPDGFFPSRPKLSLGRKCPIPASQRAPKAVTFPLSSLARPWTSRPDSFVPSRPSCLPPRSLPPRHLSSLSLGQGHQPPPCLSPSLSLSLCQKLPTSDPSRLIFSALLPSSIFFPATDDFVRGPAPFPPQSWTALSVAWLRFPHNNLCPAIQLLGCEFSLGCL